MKSELHKVVEQGYDLAPGTRARYARDLDRWIAFAGVDPRGWTVGKAQDFYSYLLERMKPDSANRTFAALAYAARWYANNAQRPELNFAMIRKVSSERSDDSLRHALSEDTVRKLLAACKGTSPMCLRDTALIVVALETGMRRMSLQSLNCESIELDNPNIGYPVARVLMKGHGTTRVPVPMSDTALVALERWRAWLKRKRGPVFVALDKNIDGHTGRTVYTPSEKALSLTAINNILVTRGDEIDAKLHPHLLRHTFITWRMRDGLSPHEIAAITGHKLSTQLGALGGYVDMRAIGEHARNSTPLWLREMFIQ